MSSPLIIYPEKNLLLPPRLFATVGHYALLASCGMVMIDGAMKFDKRRKDVHRYEIADTRGRLNLTVPVCKPESSSEALWSDIKVSVHGDWWNIHLTALESAYGRTPWFEFYVDSFRPLFRRRSGCDCESITSLCEQADSIVRNLAGIDTTVTYRHTPDTPLPAGILDMRREPAPAVGEMTYWQVRADRLGFIPDISILDLLFNHGPETPLILRRIIGAMKDVNLSE